MTASERISLISTLKDKYRDFPSIIEYLDDVKEDVVDHVDDFRNPEKSHMFMGMQIEEQADFKRYSVNLLVDHSNSKGAPVVFEDNPTYQNVVGEILEYLRARKEVLLSAGIALSLLKGLDYEESFILAVMLIASGCRTEQPVLSWPVPLFPSGT